MVHEGPCFTTWSDDVQIRRKQLTYVTRLAINDKADQQRRRYCSWPVNAETTIFGIKGEGGTGRGMSAGVAEALRMRETVPRHAISMILIKYLEGRHLL